MKGLRCTGKPAPSVEHIMTPPWRPLDDQHPQQPIRSHHILFDDPSGSRNRGHPSSRNQVPGVIKWIKENIMVIQFVTT